MTERYGRREFFRKGAGVGILRKAAEHGLGQMDLNKVKIADVTLTP